MSRIRFYISIAVLSGLFVCLYHFSAARPKTSSKSNIIARSRFDGRDPMFQRSFRIPPFQDNPSWQNKILAPRQSDRARRTLRALLPEIAYLSADSKSA